jgi:hypothetical protein
MPQKPGLNYQTFYLVHYLVFLYWLMGLFKHHFSQIIKAIEIIIKEFIEV